MSADSDRRYNLIFGVSVRNVFNKVNLANSSGILGSRFFDTPNALQGGPFSAGARIGALICRQHSASDFGWPCGRLWLLLSQWVA